MNKIFTQIYRNLWIKIKKKTLFKAWRIILPLNIRNSIEILFWPNENKRDNEEYIKNELPLATPCTNYMRFNALLENY